jgi:hypothetical protein
MSTRRKQPGWFERWLDRLGINFAAPPAVELPSASAFPPDGRSSIETAPGGSLGIMPGLGYVQPPFSLEMLRELKRLWIENPDLSQFIANHVSLANAGHTITVDTKDESKAESVLMRLNDAAQRIYRNGCGVDGLISAYIGQIACFGAISSEDIVDLAGKQVQETVLVPVDQIRFRFENGQYVPMQMAYSLFSQNRVQPAKGAIGLIELNPLTYRYYALQTIQNSPYAKPPASAAVDILLGPQKDAIDNIKWIVRKLGILGLVSVALTKPPKKTGETDGEFEGRAKEYLRRVREVLDSNFNKGLLVTFNDQKVDHANVVSDARGAADIFQMVEEQAFSGMGSLPFAHGRNYTTTETFADVIYHLLVAQAEGMQRLAKRRQEHTYRLDLALAGIEADVTISFNAVHSRNDYQTAQADQIRQTMTIEKGKCGVISPDEVAQELGYEKAFDPALLNVAAQGVAGTGLSRAKGPAFSAMFRFDRQSQRYRFVPSRIEIASGAVEAEDVRTGSGSDRVIDFKKKAA